MSGYNEDDIQDEIKRRKKATGVGAALEEPETPSGDAPPEIPKVSYHKKTATEDLQDYIKTEPKEVDYHPTKTRRFFSALSGGLTGAAYGPKAGKEAAENMIYQPFRDKEAGYKQGLKSKAALADIETSSAAAASESELKQKKGKAEDSRAEAELARKRVEDKKAGALPNNFEEDIQGKIRVKQAGGASTSLQDGHKVTLKGGGTIDAAWNPKTNQYFDTKNNLIDPESITAVAKKVETEKEFPPYQDLVSRKERELGRKLTYAESLQVQKDMPGNVMGRERIGESQVVHQDNQGAREDARSDRTYTTALKEFDALSKPLSDTSSRLSNLEESLRQGTPVALGAAATQFVTALEGGMGSGLRISKYEIDKTFGNMSVWQHFKLQAQKLATDPNAAQGMTPEFQNQVHMLAAIAKSKIDGKQHLLILARRELDAAVSIQDQRKVNTKLREHLASIDEGHLQYHDGKFYQLGADGKFHEEKD